MTTRGEVTEDLAWWRAHREAPHTAPDLRDRLARLHAWKTQHDADRARQPGPFLKMAWDAVFADEAHQVAEAIGQMEGALDGS